MTTNQIPNPKMQFFTSAGTPLVGGKLYSYAAGTTTLLSTYTDNTGVTANPNPVILDSRGEAVVWFASAQYDLVLKDANDVEIWTVDNVNGVNQPTVDYLSTIGGAALISYAPSGIGAVTTTVQSKLQQYVSVFDFMTTAQITDVQTAAGLLDVASAIMTATTACVTSGKALFFPAGTYTCTTITAQARMKWVGESSVTTIIKLKNGTNANLVNSPTSTIDDIWIESIQFDGNSAGNTSGDTLVLSGAKPTLIDVSVLRSAGNGIVTNWAGPSFRDTGFEGFFSHITIDLAQKSGWIHSGPSDSHFDGIMIIDASQKTDNAFYGLFLDPAGTGSNGRFNNLHYWNRSNVTNVATTGVYVGFGGNTFTNCHFEGAYLPLSIAAGFNTFAACEYYAPRGPYAVSFGASATGNYMDGCLGATYYTGNQNYTGINLSAVSNTINVTTGGAIKAINFNASQGNFVRISGYQDAGGVAYTGTPNATDNVLIYITGPGGGSYVSGAPWTAYTPTISSGTGTITTASATGRYSQTGKTVNIEMAVTVTTNGTGATSVIATLPYAASAFQFILAGRNNTTGKMLQGEIIAGANYIRIFNYDNTYPVADGQVLYISGTYESV